VHDHLGDTVRERCAGAELEALFAAPFIKADALARLVGSLQSAVRLRVVTRWVPEEIAAGVSDLDVWRVVCKRPHARLLLCPAIHAKYYRIDGLALVGSANLTRRGLGWTTKPGLELLLEVAAAEIADFETKLLAASLEVDVATYNNMQAAVDALAASSAIPLVASAEEVEEVAEWFPSSRQVQHLYDCYLGHQDKVISSVFEDGRLDVSGLCLPSGLGRESFENFVAARLQSLAYVAAVDARAIAPIDRRTGQGLLVDLGVARAAEDCTEWDTLSEWLLWFLPQRYRRIPTWDGPAISRSQLIR
jgi:hypothetical protein